MRLTARDALWFLPKRIEFDCGETSALWHQLDCEVTLDMTRVITYGTFDHFHEGHRRLLERARGLGDYLVVGVTSPAYDESRGKLDVEQGLLERVDNVRRSGLADEIIVEEYRGQKIRDIQQLGIDKFIIGSDWVGHFDYLGEYCEVIYLERTKGVSSSQLRVKEGGIQQIGIVGAGRIANRFAKESRYVSGVEIDSVYTPSIENARQFAENHSLRAAYDRYDDLLENVAAVYIASPHGTHYHYARQAIEAGVHVLCEKPLTLSGAETTELFDRAASRGVVLMEALKTAYAPGFGRLVTLARSGSIGSIRSVDATFTKLVKEGREYESPDGGSISELASYPLLAILKLLGTDIYEMRTTKLVSDTWNVDTFARIDLRYRSAIASCSVGIGVKAEGDLVIAGTKGYIYVPAPWWLTTYFEERFEDANATRKHYFPFEGDGLRYELSEFSKMIREHRTLNYKLTPTESIAISQIIENARADESALIEEPLVNLPKHPPATVAIDEHRKSVTA